MPGLVSEKKRKRDGEGDARPAKKAANGVTASTVKVSMLRDSGDLCPVVASSPGLSVPKSVALKAYRKRASNSPYELLLQSSAHPRLDHEARQDRTGPNSYLQHYIGVYDPATGDLKLVEARHLTLRTTLRPEELPEDEEDVRKTNAAKKFALTTEFGTKKAKKAVSSMTTNAIAPTKDGDAAISALLDSTGAAASDAPTRESLQSAVDEAKPRPIANPEAASARDVYPLATLVGAEDMARVPIQEWIDQANQGEAASFHSRFVARRWTRICKGADLTDTPTKARLIALRYLNILLQLYFTGKATRGGGRRLPKRDVLKEKLKLDDRLLNGVMRRYGAGGELTKWKLDYLVTHMCALALIVDDFYVDTNDLREDLGFKERDMQQYFREIGCGIFSPTQADLVKAKVGKEGSLQHRVAKLRLPLEFPKQRVLAQKKR